MLTFEAAGIAQDYELPAHAITIGRDPGCELQLLDRSVQRRHATLIPRRGVFLLDPLFPVLVGDRLCLHPVALLDGDTITFGTQRVGFKLPRMLAHGVVPDDLTGLPLGAPVAVLRIEHVLDGVAVGSAIDATLDPAHGMVCDHEAGMVELLIDAPGRAFALAVELRRVMSRLTPEHGLQTTRTWFQIGGDLAPLDAARAGARMALAASSGNVVMTESLFGRGMADAVLTTQRDLLTERVEGVAGETQLFAVYQK
ncbi:MAG: FHA domain-containing protein [Proteobacteria bacterium]|nr:FHA domain-containing protein [Pseudomonadota bacterium]